MVYCQRCGKQNVEGAQFCNKCGANLVGPQRHYPKKRDEQCENQCEDECQSNSKENAIFWGIVVVLIGLYVVFEFGVKRIDGLPSWVYNFEFCWILPIIIGLAILAAGVRMVIKKT